MGKDKEQKSDWLGLSVPLNWMQKTIWLLAIVIYVIFCKPFFSRFGAVASIALAFAFGAGAALLTYFFREKKPKGE